MQVELDEIAETLLPALVSGRPHEANNLVVGVWDCPNNPLGLCVYADDDDPGREACVFCGLPDERK